jgi:ribosomal protein S20
LLELYNPLADPEMKEALDVISIANSIIDEVVDKLLKKPQKTSLEKSRLCCNNTL